MVRWDLGNYPRFLTDSIGCLPSHSGDSLRDSGAGALSAETGELGRRHGPDCAWWWPGLPHHVTQRGNRRVPVFFGPEDYRLYRRLIRAAARRAGEEIWPYCLMPNHVHLIVI
jgi:hypothetical protein